MDPRREGDGRDDSQQPRTYTTTWTSPTTTTTTTTNNQGTFTSTTVTPPPPHAAETGYLQPRVPATQRAPSPLSNRAPSPRAVSPVSSLRTSQPGTPHHEGEAHGDYFGGGGGGDPPPLERNPATYQSTATAATGRSRQGSLVSRLSRRWSRDSNLSDEGRQPSIRIRRMPSAQGLNQKNDFEKGRPRSLSQPERARIAGENGGPARHSRRVPDLAMPRLTEEGNRPTLDELGVGASETGMSPLSPSATMPERGFQEEEQDLEGQQTRPGKFRSATRRMGFGRRRAGSQPMDPEERARQRANDEYDAALVDWLDTIDPEVQTLSTLTNVQNSLFIPDLGSWVNRRPAYSLSQHHPEQQFAQQHQQDQPFNTSMIPPERYRTPSAPGERSRAGTGTVREEEELERIESGIELGTTDTEDETPRMQRSTTITSRLTESHYAALPHGQQLIGWTAEEKRELDDHVRHMLHSRRSRFKRRMKGFGQYVRRPLGFLVTLYATLITLFGLAWVLFLIGWIYVGDKQVYVIHIIDSVLVALFAIMGDGLAPFRAVDTWRLWHIVRYTRIIEKAQKGIAPRPRSKLRKKNIPPEVRESMDIALATQQSQALAMTQQQTNGSTEPFPNLTGENSREVEDFQDDGDDVKSTATDDWIGVLTPKQQYKFLHHKKKLAKSHSFYKPYETFTHNQFPLSYLIAIVLLLDAHSCLQISLGATTWGIDYRTRPMAITTVILCVSITCNITAGIVISRGDRKTRKKDVMNLLDRQEITGEAIKHMKEERRKKEKKERGEEGSGSGSGGEGLGGGSELRLSDREVIGGGGGYGSANGSGLVVSGGEGVGTGTESDREGVVGSKKGESKLVKGAKDGVKRLREVG